MYRSISPARCSARTSGRKLFGDADRVDLKLDGSLPTTTGVVIAHYSVVHPAT